MMSCMRRNDGSLEAPWKPDVSRLLVVVAESHPCWRRPPEQNYRTDSGTVEQVQLHLDLTAR